MASVEKIRLFSSSSPGIIPSLCGFEGSLAYLEPFPTRQFEPYKFSTNFIVITCLCDCPQRTTKHGSLLVGNELSLELLRRVQKKILCGLQLLYVLFSYIKIKGIPTFRFIGVFVSVGYFAFFYFWGLVCRVVGKKINTTCY